MKSPVDGLSNERQHPLEGKLLLKYPSPTSTGSTHIGPQQVNPDINQQKGDADESQTHCRVFHRGGDAARVFEPVGGLDAKSQSIILIHRS
jgi:hypothetical protein